jgi:hypothetical protein
MRGVNITIYASHFLLERIKKAPNAEGRAFGADIQAILPKI